MHKGGRIQREVKLWYLIVEESGSVKLADFGFATMIEPGTLLSLSLSSPLNMAPEIATKQPYDKNVHVWAVGIVTFMVLSGSRLFLGKSKVEIFKKILNHDPEYKQLFGTTKKQ